METFNEDTGQVYVETISSAQSMVTSWPNNCTGRQEDPKTYRGSGVGCDSLYAMALRICTWNIHDRGMPETLPCYDWELMKRIYLRLMETDTLTFKAWAVFKSAFPGKTEDDYEVLVPQSYGDLTQLPSICKQVTSLPFDTLTFLCIRNLRITAVNLNTDLLKLENLAVLILEQLGVDLGDRAEDRMIIRWGSSVHETRKFQKLTVLSLKHFDISVPEALKGLTEFPALVLCNLDSRHTRQDLEPFLCTEKPYMHPNGQWRQNLANNEVDSDPEMTSKRNDITTHLKMHKLHAIATKYRKALYLPIINAPILSIQYGHSKPRIQPHTSSDTWFLRIYPPANKNNNNNNNNNNNKPPEQHQASTKRTLHPEPNNAASATRKRKMQSSKQRDVASMLGSFG